MDVILKAYLMVKIPNCSPASLTALTNQQIVFSSEAFFQFCLFNSHFSDICKVKSALIHI